MEVAPVVQLQRVVVHPHLGDAAGNGPGHREPQLVAPLGCQGRKGCDLLAVRQGHGHRNLDLLGPEAGQGDGDAATLEAIAVHRAQRRQVAHGRGLHGHRNDRASPLDQVPNLRGGRCDDAGPRLVRVDQHLAGLALEQAPGLAQRALHVGVAVARLHRLKRGAHPLVVLGQLGGDAGRGPARADQPHESAARQVIEELLSAPSCGGRQGAAVVAPAHGHRIVDHEHHRPGAAELRGIPRPGQLRTRRREHQQQHGEGPQQQQHPVPNAPPLLEPLHQPLQQHHGAEGPLGVRPLAGHVGQDRTGHEQAEGQGHGREQTQRQGSPPSTRRSSLCRGSSVHAG